MYARLYFVRRRHFISSAFLHLVRAPGLCRVVIPQDIPRGLFTPQLCRVCGVNMANVCQLAVHGTVTAHLSFCRGRVGDPGACSYCCICARLHGPQRLARSGALLPSLCTEPWRRPSPASARVQRLKPPCPHHMIVQPRILGRRAARGPGALAHEGAEDLRVIQRFPLELLKSAGFEMASQFKAH